jgi:hypothetical protein
MPAKAQFLKWRERKEENRWSETLYQGLLLQVECDGSVERMFVSKLSHGLRVLPYKGRSEYLIVENGELIDVPEDFLQEALAFYQTDKAFQRYLARFQSLCSQ